MNNYKIKDFKELDVMEILKFRNSIFPGMDLDRWNKLGNQGVAVTIDNKIKGILPLQPRAFKITNEILFNVINENNVCVDSESRGLKLGERMIQAAHTRFKGKFDSLNVFRFDERSPAYRFYRKTNHSDLYFAKLLSLKKNAEFPGNIRNISFNEFLTYEERIITLFNKNYCDYSGHNIRSDKFYTEGMDKHIYFNSNWRYLISETNSVINGFLILNPDCELSGGWVIYDAAGEDDTIFNSLLNAANNLAHMESKAVEYFINEESPWYECLIRTGFKPVFETPFLMAQELDVKSSFEHYLNSRDFNEGLIINTPHGGNTVFKGDNPMRISMKKSVLTKMLFKRISFKNAIKEGQIRVLNSSPFQIKQLEECFTFQKWIVPALDFI